MIVAVSAGFLPLRRVSGKHTSVCDPSNSRLVGWICRFSAGLPKSEATACSISERRDDSKSIYISHKTIKTRQRLNTYNLYFYTFIPIHLSPIPLYLYTFIPLYLNPYTYTPIYLYTYILIYLYTLIHLYTHTLTNPANNQTPTEQQSWHPIR